MNVPIDSALLDGLTAPPLEPKLGADCALIRLLTGTEPRVVRVEEKTVSVVTEAEARRAAKSRNPNTVAAYESGDSQAPANGDAANQRAQSDERQAEANGHRSGIEAIFTAQKREEWLTDVPIRILALGGGDLQERRVTRLEDLPSFVPHLAISTSGNNHYSELHRISSANDSSFHVTSY